jgi:hypothetical protein
MTLAEKCIALAKVNDLDRLLLGLNCLSDEVRDMIRAKDDAFIDGVLNTRRDQPSNLEKAA